MAGPLGIGLDASFARSAAGRFRIVKNSPCDGRGSRGIGLLSLRWPIRRVDKLHDRLARAAVELHVVGWAA